MYSKQDINKIITMYDRKSNYKMFDFFFKNKNKINENYLKHTKICKIFLYSIFLSFFIYSSFDFVLMVYNKEVIPPENFIFVFLSFMSILFVWVVIDLFHYFIFKYYNLRYKYLLEIINNKKKYNTFYSLIKNVKFKDNLSWEYLMELNLQNIQNTQAEELKYNVENYNFRNKDKEDYILFLIEQNNVNYE